MSDNIKASISVVYTEGLDNKQTRFMDDSVVHNPISYYTGKATIPGAMKNYELAASVNMVCLNSSSQFNVKIGDTTAPELTNLRMFVYDGDTTTIFVSNISNDPVVIKVVTAKY